MVLSRVAIQKALDQGLLRIAPFSHDQIQAAHIDLYLDGNSPLVISPQTFLTAQTREKISIAESLCGFLEGRTSLAKQGVSVEQSSTFIQPASDNKMLLEIFNASSTTVTIPISQPIAKMILIQQQFPDR